MDPHLPGRSPVNVRLMGTVTQPFEILQVLGQTPSDSYPRQIAECFRHVKLVTQPNHGITNDHVCAVSELAHLGREVPFSQADDLVSLLADGELLHMMRCFKDALVFPSIQRLERPHGLPSMKPFGRRYKPRAMSRRKIAQPLILPLDTTYRQALLAPQS